ncbi:Aste57867_4658 [Aphanomyces stellatus]|uniref:Aste57867_4658 protein n=1 Tax=Aphanomyces stellatus TaxID=120398 RepID=A0A485KC40_9STRA|nr:hypothetical protein As57867_004645 [Aphanomyces stellatus]VFT81761.1 Aste57867_4658 [Aphanomyces stellatus]
MMRSLFLAIVATAAVAQTCSPTESDTDYYGNDLTQTQQDNSEDCCGDCTNTAGCVAYSWRDGTCYLKKSKGTAQWAPGVQSAAIPIEGRTCGKVEKNTDYPGNDISRMSTSNSADCCALCDSNSECVVSVWFKGACYLKRTLGSKTTVKGAEAIQVKGAGPAPPAPSPSPPSPPSPGNGDLGDQVARQLTIIRAAHGLGPVTYDAGIAAQMQAWADDCSQHPGGGHGGPYGVQNLASAPDCGTNCLKEEGPSWWWYAGEVVNFNFQSQQCDLNVNDGGCGHFVNSLGTWVTKVGCGWSTCYNPSIGKNDPLIWCNYDGNGDDRAIPGPKKSLAQVRTEMLSGY